MLIYLILLESPTFLETRPVTDESKRTYVPVEDDIESPAEKRNKIYEKLQDHIPDAVGVLYWKEQQKQFGSTNNVEDEKRKIEIPK